MDISAVVVVLILIVLFLGAVVWMEVQSRQTSSRVSLKNGDSPESKETDLDQYSPFFPLQPDRTASSQARAEEKEL